MPFSSGIFNETKISTEAVSGLNLVGFEHVWKEPVINGGTTHVKIAF